MPEGPNPVPAPPRVVPVFGVVVYGEVMVGELPIVVFVPTPVPVTGVEVGVLGDIVGTVVTGPVVLVPAAPVLAG